MREMACPPGLRHQGVVTRALREATSSLCHWSAQQLLLKCCLKGLVTSSSYCGYSVPVLLFSWGDYLCQKNTDQRPLKRSFKFILSLLGYRLSHSINHYRVWEIDYQNIKIPSENPEKVPTPYGNHIKSDCQTDVNGTSAGVTEKAQFRATKSIPQVFTLSLLPIPYVALHLRLKLGDGVTGASSFPAGSLQLCLLGPWAGSVASVCMYAYMVYCETD